MNTIAELRAADQTKFVDGRNIYVNGYYTSNDGGGGIFYYDSDSTATDNGGTVIQPDSGSGRYVRVVDRARWKPEWFGARPDIGDVTTLFQACINAAPNGAQIEVSRGTTTFSNLTINKPLSIVGVSMSQSVLASSDLTGNCISVTTTLPVEFRDLIITKITGSTKSAGSYIHFDPATGVNVNSSLYRVSFPNAYKALDFVNAALWTVNECQFVSYTNKAISVACDSSPDTGDSTITGCIFNGSAGSTAIYQQHSGGLRILNNKFLNGYWHYLLETPAATTQTGNLIISNNSFEWATQAAVAFNSLGQIFSYINISDNLFSVNLNGKGINFTAQAAYAYLYDVLIGGNVFHQQAGNCIGINIGDGSRIALMPNLFTGASDSEVGIYFYATSGVVYMAQQNFENIASAYAGDVTRIHPASWYEYDTGARFFGDMIVNGTLNSVGTFVANGSVQTGAPAGGTAAPFRIGTVHAISPATHNRTIEIQISGITYYLAAKTTND